MSVNISVEQEQPSLSDRVLNQISECSPEGFMLFYIGSKGEPEYYSTSKNAIYARALVSFLSDLLETGADDVRKPNDAFNDSKVIPKLFEHTAGGYLLVYIDKGDAAYITEFDNKIVKRGLVSFTKDILAGLRFVEQSEYAGHFLGHEDSGDDDNS
jgi:hypothetical protein